jgi:ubiquinone/menaquinone biosynthesis C-methylase UbiE
MDHLKRVTDEFTHQAHTFEAWAEKVDGNVATRFGLALGNAARGRLLDVACGPGVVTVALAPNAASVVAFDATEQMLEKAKARCGKAGATNVVFKSGDAERLPFGDGEFDGAVTRAAVHHFADPQRAINEMFRVLRPGGIAIILNP